MMWQVVYTIADNVGLDVKWIIFLIFLIGGLLFYVTDFKIGAMANFLLNTLMFIIMYGIDDGSKIWVPFLWLSLMHFVILALSLYTINKSVSTGGII